MSTVVKFRISPVVAAFVRPGVTSDKKLAGLRTASLMEPFEKLTLLFLLKRDADSVVAEAALAAFTDLPGDCILQYVRNPEAHPTVLDELAKAHHDKPDVARALLGAEHLSVSARQFLESLQPVTPVAPEAPAGAEDGSDEVVEHPVVEAIPVAVDQPEAECGTEVEESAEIDEEGEQFLSKYKIAMVMGIGEKIKMALTGDKEWRAILIKDANKLVSGSVIKNPRITDAEILNILKVGVQNDEIIRLICANKEWVKNYLIRKALISCPKTPLPNALRYLATMNEKDVAGYAKSKNISSVLSTQAKRILLAKKR